MSVGHMLRAQNTNIYQVQKGVFPAIDVSESDNSLLFRAELPGFDKNDLEVVYEKDRLILRGNRKLEMNSMKVYLKERFQGKFERQFVVSEELNPSEFKASYKDGILSVSIPKKEELKFLDIPIN